MTCTNENPGNVYGRAYCVLNKIHTQCTQQPIPNLSQGECDRITSIFERDDMVGAINEWFAGDPCLANYIIRGGSDWQAIGCP